MLMSMMQEVSLPQEIIIDSCAQASPGKTDFLVLSFAVELDTR